MNRGLFVLPFIIGMLLCVLTQAQLQANFDASNTLGCSPMLVDFSDLSTGSPTSWSWDLGNGTTSNLQNPAAVYLNPGTYSVRLTVSNLSGSDTKTVTNYITVAPTPVINFSANDSGSICPGRLIQFNNLSTPGTAGNITYLWDFGDGNTSDLASPTHEYLNTGNYNISLSISNAAGCSNVLTKTAYINVIPRSVPRFTATNNNSCTLPLNVSFTSSSTGATSYLWDFGDGNTSTQASPSNTYTTAGSYTVRLITTNAAGCSDTMIRTSYVNIGTLRASFSTNTSSSCTNNNINFTNTSLPGPGVSTWYFGDGTSAIAANTRHAYSTPGTYAVKLVVRFNNCIDSVSRTVQVAQGPTVAFSATPTTGCTLPFATQFTNTTAGANSYLWRFGDGGTSTGVNPTHSYNAYGNYTVSLVATNTSGCSDTVVKPAYVTPSRDSMTVSASPASGCVQNNIVFTANLISSQPGSNYIWNFGDGTVITGGTTMSHAYANPGNYNVSVNFTTGQSCNFTSRITVVRIGIKPAAGFSAAPTNICPEQLVAFTNTTTGTAPITYNWNFGDGTATSGALNPTHRYNLTGLYTVRLIATNNGCSDTSIIPNLVSVKDPTARFRAAFNCNNRKEISFIDSSSNANSWHWDFGDGDTSILQNPTHIYDTFGNFTVKLTVRNAANSCAATRTLTVRVADLEARFITNNAIACKQSVILRDTSVGSVSRYWSFGDGDTSILQRPTHAYAAAGTYIVRLIASDANSCKDTVERNIQVTGVVLDITASDTFATCPPLSVRFANNSTGATSYAWSFDNGNTSSSANPTALFTRAKVYTVKLTGRNAYGCSDSTTQQITVLGPSGDLSYGPLLGCSEVTVQFSCTNNSNVQEYLWDMNNGFVQTTTTPSFSYTYTQVGKYVPKLLLKSGTCIVPIVGTDTISVDRIDADFTFTPDSICQAGTVQFKDTVLFSVNPATSRSWNFGDGSTSIARNPVHRYTAPGNYNVVLIIGGNGGCNDTIAKTVTVLPAPDVSAGNDTGVCDRQLSPLQLQATGAVSYTWSPATGLSCTNCSNPIASFNRTVTYTVVGTGENGCTDTGRITITVNPNPSISVSRDTVICSGNGVQLVASGAQSYTWSPVTNLSCINCSNPIATPILSTLYEVIGSSSAGCTDTGSATITVNPSPTVNAGSDQTIMAGSSVELSAEATNTTQYLWSPATGLSCSDCANPVATPEATTTYTIVVSNEFGCTARDQITLSIKCDNSLFSMPNTFSPNGDGNNDKFYPLGRGIVSVKRFRIYNRWGEVMYDVQNIPPNEESYGWDGYYKNKELNPDVFVYVIDAICGAGQTLQVKGDVSLMK